MDDIRLHRRGQWFSLRNDLIDGGLPSVLGASAWTLLTAMLRHADAATGRCFVGYRALCRETGLSTSTIARAVALLESLGIKRPDPTPGRPNQYLLILPSASEIEALSQSKRASILRVDALSKSKSKNTKRRRLIKSAHSNDQNERQGSHSDGNGRRRSNSKPSTESFPRWWEAYPRKVAKRRAEKAYGPSLGRLAAELGLSLSEAEAELLKRTEAFAAAKAETESQYIPHPATWLNGDQWADELDQEKTQDVGTCLREWIATLPGPGERR